MLDARSQGVSYVYLRVLRKRFTVSTVLANSTMFIVRGKFPPIRDVSVGTIKKRGNRQSAKRWCSCARRCGLCMVLVGVCLCGCLRATVLAHSCVHVRVCWLRDRSFVLFDGE